MLILLQFTHRYQFLPNTVSLLIWCYKFAGFKGQIEMFSLCGHPLETILYDGFVNSAVTADFLHFVTGGCGDEYRSKSIRNQQGSRPSANPTNILCFRIDTGLCSRKCLERPPMPHTVAIRQSFKSKFQFFKQHILHIFMRHSISIN